MLKIFNKKLLNYIYKKCVSLNYLKTYKMLKLDNLSNINNFIINKNINYIKNFYKSSAYIHLKYKDIKRINKNLKSGVLLLSTSVGVITNKKAEFLKLGGILLCYIS